MSDLKNKEILDLEDLASTEDILIYMSRFMPSGNFEKESLPDKLRKKSLTHPEFNELCENVLDFIMTDNWYALEDRTILEDVIVMTAEQALLCTNMMPSIRWICGRKCGEKTISGNWITPLR